LYKNLCDASILFSNLFILPGQPERLGILPIPLFPAQPQILHPFRELRGQIVFLAEVFLSETGFCESQPYFFAITTGSPDKIAPQPPRHW
jgi:hypothetical protein